MATPTTDRELLDLLVPGGEISSGMMRYLAERAFQGGGTGTTGTATSLTSRLYATLADYLLRSGQSTTKVVSPAILQQGFLSLLYRAIVQPGDLNHSSSSNVTSLKDDAQLIARIGTLLTDSGFLSTTTGTAFVNNLIAIAFGNPKPDDTRLLNLARLPIIPTDKIDDGAITQRKLAKASVGRDEIFPNAIQDKHLQVVDPRLDPPFDRSTAPNAYYGITGNKLEANTIGTREIGTNAVRSDELAPLSVAHEHMNLQAIQGENIADGTSDVNGPGIRGRNINNRAITRTKIALGAIGTGELGDKQVTKEKLADNAVRPQHDPAVIFDRNVEIGGSGLSSFAGWNVLRIVVDFLDYSSYIHSRFNTDENRRLPLRAWIKFTVTGDTINENFYFYQFIEVNPNANYGSNVQQATDGINIIPSASHTWRRILSATDSRINLHSSNWRLSNRIRTGAQLNLYYTKFTSSSRILTGSNITSGRYRIRMEYEKWDTNTFLNLIPSEVQIYFSRYPSITGPYSNVNFGVADYAYTLPFGPKQSGDAQSYFDPDTF